MQLFLKTLDEILLLLCFVVHYMYVLWHQSDEDLRYRSKYITDEIPVLLSFSGRLPILLKIIVTEPKLSEKIYYQKNITDFQKVLHNIS